MYTYCKLNNLKYSRIRGRLKKGYSLEDAINLKKILPKRKYTCVNGQSLYTYCKLNNLNFTTMYARLKRGYSFEEAINLKKIIRKSTNKKRIPATVDGLTCSEYCKKHNVDKKVFYKIYQILKED